MTTTAPNTTTPDTTTQPDLDELMSERTVPPAARAVALDAVQRVHEQGGSVVVRPSQGHISLLGRDGGVGVFVHPRRFGLTFDKAVALDLVERYAICELENGTNRRTGRVQITHDRLRDARWTAIVTDLLVEALSRSRQDDPARSGAPRAAAPLSTPATPQCPIHQQAMFGGSCYLCD